MNHARAAFGPQEPIHVQPIEPSMSRDVLINLDEGEVVSKCLAAKVGISVLERLPEGGVRLVCMSSDGAATIRRKLKSKLISGDVRRELLRPLTPMW